MTNFYVLLLCYITSLQFIYIDCEPTDVLQGEITVDLATYNKWNKSSHVFTRNFTSVDGNAIVNVINSPNNQGFFVIQAHSLYVNITLSSAANSIKGTNIGLVQKLASSNPTFRFNIRYVEKPIFEKVLVAVVVYEKEDPIPGGCNMVFNTEYAPYQLIHYNDNMVQLDVQPASVYNHICEENQARLSVYHGYLYERNLDENVYFDFIVNMLTPDKIQENGKLVPIPVGHSYLRRYFSAYPGIGTIYAVVARYGNLTSAYVPAVTYACNINNWDIDCIGPVTIPWKILCSLLLFMGMFTCYLGHRFFKTQMFLFGFVFGGFVSFISASLNNNLSVEQGVIISALFGAIYGATWIILWWRFGSPVLSVLLPVAFIGYLTSCIVFYTDFGDLSMFQSDLNYWGTFFSIALPITLVLLVTTMFANILACSVLGATAVVVSLDHYIGGNLHYIIVNNVRRATISKFNFAVLDPPFQYRDILLIVLWTLLVLTGIYAQLKQQRGKPPFPPPTAAMRVNSERAPLLSRTYSNNYLTA